jgi:hypothetical protein
MTNVPPQAGVLNITEESEQQGPVKTMEKQECDQPLRAGLVMVNESKRKLWKRMEARSRALNSWVQKQGAISKLSSKRRVNEKGDVLSGKLKRKGHLRPWGLSKDTGVATMLVELRYESTEPTGSMTYENC